LYSDSQAPQKLGPGFTERIIEAYVTAADNSYIAVGNILSQSQEHSLLSTMYNYYKLINIAVVFLPSMSQVQSPSFVLQMNWSQDLTTENLINEDSTKIVPKYRTRKYFYKFVPPDMNYLVGEPEAQPQPKLSCINPSKFNRTYIPAAYFPGRVIFDTTLGTFSDFCRILLRVEYRGSKIPDSNQLNLLAKRFESSSSAKGLPKEIGLKLGKSNQLVEVNKANTVQEENEDSEYEGDDEFIKTLNN
jgi:hypothetical protein